MKIKDCMQGTLIGKEESIDVWLCRECRSGAKKEPKDHKEAMEYASCVDTQSHLKKCKKCKELKQEWGSEKEARDDFEKWLKQEYKEEVKKMIEGLKTDDLCRDCPHDHYDQALKDALKKLENL